MNDPVLRRSLRSIAANVRSRRLALRLTQEELSEGAAITYRYLQDVEAGRKNITIRTLVCLAKALRVAPIALLRQARLPAPRPGRPSRRGARVRGVASPR